MIIQSQKYQLYILVWLIDDDQKIIGKPTTVVPYQQGDFLGVLTTYLITMSQFASLLIFVQKSHTNMPNMMIRWLICMAYLFSLALLRVEGHLEWMFYVNASGTQLGYVSAIAFVKGY